MPGDGHDSFAKLIWRLRCADIASNSTRQTVTRAGFHRLWRKAYADTLPISFVKAASPSSIGSRSPAAARLRMFFAISARMASVRMAAGNDAIDLIKNTAQKREVFRIVDNVSFAQHWAAPLIITRCRPKSIEPFGPFRAEKRPPSVTRRSKLSLTNPCRPRSSHFSAPNRSPRLGSEVRGLAGDATLPFALSRRGVAPDGLGPAASYIHAGKMG